MKKDMKKKYNKHNDANWCCRFPFMLIGIVFILMKPSGLKEIVESDNKAVLGLLFLIIGIMHHVLYRERKASRELIQGITGVESKNNEDTQQEN